MSENLMAQARLSKQIAHACWNEVNAKNFRKSAQECKEAAEIERAEKSNNVTRAVWPPRSL